MLGKQGVVFLILQTFDEAFALLYQLIKKANLKKDNIPEAAFR